MSVETLGPKTRTSQNDFNIKYPYHTDKHIIYHPNN